LLLGRAPSEVVGVDRFDGLLLAFELLLAAPKTHTARAPIASSGGSSSPRRPPNWMFSWASVAAASPSIPRDLFADRHDQEGVPLCHGHHRVVTKVEPKAKPTIP
jgi:hypothetical protein